MSFAQTKSFHATFYRFTRAGQDEIARRFDATIRDQSATCRYLSAEDVFVVECAADESDEINSSFIKVLERYIDEAGNVAEEQERPPNVRRLRDSCDDENILSALHFNTTTNAEELNSGRATKESKACSYHWKPKAAVPILSVIDEAQLPLLALDTQCTLSFALDDNSILIEASNFSEVDFAIARLANLERSLCVEPIEIHRVETERSTEDFKLRCHGLSWPMLKQTIVREIDPLKDNLHTMRTCGWYSYSRVDNNYVLQPKKPTEPEGSSEIEQLSFMWNHLPLLSIGSDDLKPPEVEGQQPSVSQAVMLTMEPEKAIQVDQWIRDIEQSPPELLTSRSASPAHSSAMVHSSSAVLGSEGLNMPSVPLSPTLARKAPSSVVSSRAGLPLQLPTRNSTAPSALEISRRAAAFSTRASVCSTTTIRRYEDTPFGQEPWANKIVGAGGRQGKLIDVSVPDTAVSQPAIPPGYPSGSQRQGFRCPEGPGSVTDENRHREAVVNRGTAKYHASSGRGTILHGLPKSQSAPSPVHVQNNMKTQPSGRSPKVAVPTPQASYSSVAQAAREAPVERRAEWSEVKSRRRHRTMKQQAKPPKWNRHSTAGCTAGPSMSSPTVSATPPRALSPNPAEAQKATNVDNGSAPHLISPVLEPAPGQALEDTPTESIVRQDMIGPGLGKPISPIKAASRSSSPETSALQSAILKILEVARVCQGRVRIEVQFGRILLSNVPKELRAAPVTKENWESVMAADVPVTSFTNMLTASDRDTAHILTLKASTGHPLFDAIACDSSVTYVLDCAHVHHEDQLRLTVDQSDPAAYTVERRPKTIGSVYWHFPKRTWDARVAVTGTGKVTEDAALHEATKDLVASMHVRVREGHITPLLYFKETSKQLHVKNVLLKKELRFRCTDHPTLALKMVEVQVLVLAVGFRQDRVVKAYTRDTVAEMISEHRHWYEVSIEPLQPVTAFAQNMELRPGEEASWTAKDIFSENPDLLRGMKEMAQYVATRIDNIGFYNKGPRGGQGDVVHEQRTAKQSEAKADGGSFW